MFYFDTSALIPYFTIEANSPRVEAFLVREHKAAFAISQWSITEFYSALGIKARTGQLTGNLHEGAVVRFEAARARSFETLHVKAEDYLRGAEMLKHWKLGLRSGDALHLAIAERHEVQCLYSYDERLLKAARHFKIPAKAI